jgi:predicted transcriptional regulator
MDFHKTIKEKGLFKKWIAKQIGISNVLLSYYLNGTRPMPDHIERKLKDILN